LLVDDLDRRGHFYTDLRQYEVPDMVGQCIQMMEYDEVTARILLQISGIHFENPELYPDRLLLADLSPPRHEKPYD